MMKPARPDPADDCSATSALPASRMALLFAVTLAAAAGNTAMQSIMPAIGAQLQIADVWVAMANTSAAILWMLMAPIWARRSDKRGRKAMIAIGLTGYTISFLICAVVLWSGFSGLISAGMALFLFAVGRAIFGIFGSASPPAAQAYVASRTTRAQRTAKLTLLASSFSLGTVLGPAAAPLMILPGLGLASPFLIYGLIGLAMLASLHWLLPDDRPAFAARGRMGELPMVGSGGVLTGDLAGEDDPATVDAPRLRFSDPRLRHWLLAAFWGGNAQAALSGVGGFLILDRLGLRNHADAAMGPVGLVMMSGAIATLLAQWGLIPTFKLGPRRASQVGMIFAIGGTALFCIGQDLHTLVLGYSLAMLGHGLFRPGFTAGSSLAVSRAEQGQVAGIVIAVNGASFIFAPVLGVWVYGHWPLAGFVALLLLCLAVLVLVTFRIAPDEP